MPLKELPLFLFWIGAGLLLLLSSPRKQIIEYQSFASVDVVLLCKETTCQGNIFLRLSKRILNKTPQIFNYYNHV